MIAGAPRFDEQYTEYCRHIESLVQVLAEKIVEQRVLLEQRMEEIDSGALKAETLKEGGAWKKVF